LSGRCLAAPSPARGEIRPVRVPCAAASGALASELTYARN
jgi:hypothetical protein